MKQIRFMTAKLTNLLIITKKSADFSLFTLNFNLLTL